MDLRLSLIIPCYNEEQNIRLGALDKVARYMESVDYSWEVLIIDDGSTDESTYLIKGFVKKNPRFKLIENPHRGKAATVVSGMMLGKGDFILFADLDQATPIDQIERLWPWFDKKFDIVIGSRKNRRQGAPFLRRLMGPGFMIVRNMLLGLGAIEDTQCGFKMFRKEVVRKVFPKLKLYSLIKQTSGPRVTAGFDVEVLYVATKMNFTIKEVYVDWHYVDTRRVSPLADSIDALLDILRIKKLSWQGVYD